MQASGAGVPAAQLEILAYDSQGRVTSYRQGGKVITGKRYDAATGRLLGTLAQVDGQAEGSLFKQSYAYDSLGNLTSRSDGITGVQESFGYDNLNRLTNYTNLGGGVSPAPQTVEVVYDVQGNIAYKSDVGRYWYDSARPNRLVQVTVEGYVGAQALSGTRAMSYAFDDYRPGADTSGQVPLGNGNLMYTASRDAVSGRHTLRWESYTSFNMPREVKYDNLITPGVVLPPEGAAASRVLAFTYGPEHQRVKQVVTLSSNAPTKPKIATTWYLHESNNNLLYEKEVKDGITEHRHYLQAAGMTFGMAVERSGTGVIATATDRLKRPTQLTYYQQDHLGSIVVVTDEAGIVIERMAFDPWGKRRFNTGLTDVNDKVVGVNTDRGFTEHEHLDEVGVIHMNGRLYDPLIGRFMSADPHVTDPYDLRSFNRYSYVWNNPLAMTDPSGYDGKPGENDTGCGCGDGYSSYNFNSDGNSTQHDTVSGGRTGYHDPGGFVVDGLAARGGANNTAAADNIPIDVQNTAPTIRPEYATIEVGMHRYNIARNGFISITILREDPTIRGLYTRPGYVFDGVTGLPTFTGWFSLKTDDPKNMPGLAPGGRTTGSRNCVTGEPQSATNRRGPDAAMTGVHNALNAFGASVGYVGQFNIYR